MDETLTKIARVAPTQCVGPASEGLREWRSRATERPAICQPNRQSEDCHRCWPHASKLTRPKTTCKEWSAKHFTSRELASRSWWQWKRKCQNWRRLSRRNQDAMFGSRPVSTQFATSSSLHFSLSLHMPQQLNLN